MVDFGRFKNSPRAMTAGAALLVVLGAAGGAGAVQATRPTIEMAPTVQTPIAKLGEASGVVTVKGRVAEVFGDRFVVQDASGRAMIAAGHEARGAVSVGQPLMVQGRFDDGQLRASYLVDQNGAIAAVGPREWRRGGHEGPGYHSPRAGHGRDDLLPVSQGCAPVSDNLGNPSAAAVRPPN